MPNGTQGQALLPGWAPDATQLIHFHSGEQVPRASQAAGLEIALVIWPQALGKSKGISHDSMPTSSSNVFRVPCRAAARLHRPILTLRLGGLQLQLQHRPGPPGRAVGLELCPHPARLLRSRCLRYRQHSLPGLYTQPACAQNQEHSSGAGDKLLFTCTFLQFPCSPSPHKHGCAHTAPTCPAAARSAASGEVGTCGRERKNLWEPEIGKAKGFVFPSQTAATR